MLLYCNLFGQPCWFFEVSFRWLPHFVVLLFTCICYCFFSNNEVIVHAHNGLFTSVTVLISYTFFIYNYFCALQLSFCQVECLFCLSMLIIYSTIGCLIFIWSIVIKALEKWNFLLLSQSGQLLKEVENYFHLRTVLF